jgi:hypothetical protein
MVAGLLKELDGRLGAFLQVSPDIPVDHVDKRRVYEQDIASRRQNIEDLQREVGRWSKPWSPTEKKTNQRYEGIIAGHERIIEILQGWIKKLPAG